MADVDLAGNVPLVLLPVRVEVRSTPDQAALRVRIFPDTIHTESLDEGLSDRERAAGVKYWEAVWSDVHATEPWLALLKSVGARRAPWVAQALRPTNLAARPADAPLFPAVSPRSTRPAVARTLPDRFFVRVEQDGADPVTTEGAEIPDELPVGLADRSELTALTIDGMDLPPVDESLRWLVDYAEAQRVGMAVTVALPLPGHTVRRLVVYGVRGALDPAQGAARLERLLRSHRFTDGAEFVAQGTPTNNTESARTDWSRRTPPGPPDLAGDSAPGAGANATVTAAALGVDPALLATLPRAHDGEQSRAAAFHTALWTTTWGDAIEHLTRGGRANGDERLSSAGLDAVRDHWVEFVRGRGPLPVLRLGRQPYGVLPVVATNGSWRPLRGGFVENRLVPFLDQQVRWMWREATAAVATVMNRPLDEALPEILGTDAALIGLRVRTALTPDSVFETAAALTLPDLGPHAAQKQVRNTLDVLAGVEIGPLDDAVSLGKKTRSLALPLVHETDTAFVAGLLEPEPAPMPHRSVLQVLLAHAAEVERHHRGSLAPPEMHGRLREATDGAHADFDRGLVFGALDAVFEAQAFDDPIVAEAAEHLTERLGRLDMHALADRHPIPALAPATIIEQVAGREPSFDRLRSDLGIQLIGEIFHVARRAAAFRAALETISTISEPDERRLLLAETLDCCSHRLDAWITSAASLRLRDLRVSGARGTFLGAYGWLDNIELRTPTPAGQIEEAEVLHDGADGGYIHAPGLTQAATAGVLRSGRLTHRRGDPNDSALDIDLSSTRVRDAIALLDGMRRGQTLGALLGYRLERRLHERSGGPLELDRFIYVLRTLAPLRGGKLTEPGVAVQESLAASDVVDGLVLREIPWATVLDKLNRGPEDLPHYIPAGSWRPPEPDEADAVQAAIEELKRTLDAVADLLLAESVHQVVTGNPARAAAALDALGAGEAVPPEPDVVRTPRTGTSIQHRVAILVPEPPPAATPGWDTGAPRARAEPRLEVWAQGALGDPAFITVAVDRPETLADAGLAALDVLYDADGDAASTSSLGARLRGRLGLGPEADLSPLARTWELAGMLRSLLATGRALDGADVGLPTQDDAVGRVPNGAEILARAAAAVDALAAAADSVLGPDVTALAPFGIPAPVVSDTLPLSEAEQGAAREALVAQARGRVTAAQLLLARTAPPPPAEPLAPRVVAELAAQVLAAVFGAGFVAVPVLSAPPPGEADPWADAVGPSGVRARPGADIRPWLARAGTLRAATGAYGETLLVREAVGGRPLLRVVQTPAGGYGTWAGREFPDSRPPLVPLAAMVAEVTGDPEPDLAGAVAGVVLDEWSEVVPQQLKRGDPANPEFVNVTTTGVALNANAPGARPPQAILVALSPDGGAWTGERLVAVLDETRVLAQMRCVTLEQVPFVARYLPALYFRDWSLQGEPAIDWNVVSSVYDQDSVTKFLQVEQ